MEPIFYITLGSATLLLLLSGVLLLISERRKTRAAKAAMADAGAALTARIGDLWLDEDRKKWLIAHESSRIPVHTYDSVLSAELSADGVDYIWKDGAICNEKGEPGWPPKAPEASGTLLPGSKPRAKNIYLNIFINDPACPVETLVLLGRPCAYTSRAYRDAAVNAGALMKLFNTLNTPAR